MFTYIHVDIPLLFLYLCCMYLFHSPIIYTTLSTVAIKYVHYIFSGPLVKSVQCPVMNEGGGLVTDRFVARIQSDHVTCNIPRCVLLRLDGRLAPRSDQSADHVKPYHPYNFFHNIFAKLILWQNKHILDEIEGGCRGSIMSRKINILTTI